MQVLAACLTFSTQEIKPDPADAEVIQDPQGSIEFDDVAFVL